MPLRRQEDLDLEVTDWLTELFLFNLQFGYPTANFGLITRGQSHSTDVTWGQPRSTYVNHCVISKV